MCMGFDQSALKKVGESVVERAVDAVLVIVYFNLEVAPLLRSKRYKIEGKVTEDLEKFNYQTLKRAYKYLIQKGLIRSIKETKTLPAITKLGENRLKRILPFYDEKRVWDGKIYLVTYDIPETIRKKRDYLRNFLQKIGCGMLQQSVWLTPYNPVRLVDKFIKEHDLSEELILVSSIGKDGTVGQMTLSELMEKIYKLTALNQRYLEFMSDLKSGKTAKAQLIFHFLTILKDDPQLPFPLLPDGWVGDKAYRILKEILSKP